MKSAIVALICARRDLIIEEGGELDDRISQT